MQINRQVFFDAVRNSPFPGQLTASQVDGMQDLLEMWFWETSGSGDIRHLAYIFATDFHETGARMQPVRETFAKSDKEARRGVTALAQKRGPGSAVAEYSQPHPETGHVYYGRGDVQLTWFENYRRMGEALGVDLVNNPDLALDPKISKRIMIEGMRRGHTGKGDFTGKALGDYFNDHTDDPVGARRIVNGSDKARLIALYHEAFLDALVAAEAAAAPRPGKPPERVFDSPSQKPPVLPPASDPASVGTGIAVIGGLSAVVERLTERVTDPWALTALVAVLAGAGLYIFGRSKITKETGR